MNSRTKFTASLFERSLSELATPPGSVHRKSLTLLAVVRCLDLARLLPDEFHLGARLLQRVPGRGELHLFDTVGSEECDLAPF
jgi:hypothetical protein